MDKWNDVFLFCKNPEAVRACAKGILRRDYDEDHPWKKGETEFQALTRDGVFHNKVIKISKLFPDDVIDVQYLLYSHTVHAQYLNGEYTEIALYPSYNVTRLPPIKNEADYDAISKKAHAFWNRLDDQERDNDGKLFLKRFSEAVIYLFFHDGVEGKKYKVEATRIIDDISFKVFENLDGDWQEIGDLPEDDSDAPSLEPV